MILIEYLSWLLAHLGLLALMLLAAGGIGTVALRTCVFQSTIERMTFAVAVGLGICALCLWVLGLLGLLYPSPITIATGVLAIGSVVGLIRGVRLGRGSSLHHILADHGSHKWLWALVIVLGVSYWSLLLWVTQYPPSNWDSTMYHLVLSRHYLNEHRLVPHNGVIFPVLPALNHLLFTWALALGDDVLAQMVEHVFLMLTAIASYAWGVRAKNSLLGLAAAALWLSHPLVLWLGESAYVDVGLATFAFLGVFALRVFREGRENFWWYLGMSLFGFAAGVKMPGLMFIALGAGFGLWSLLRKRALPGTVVKGWLLAFVIAAPWYAFIAYHTGNPIWPVLSHLSRNVWNHPSVLDGYGWIMSVGMPKTVVNFLLAPIEMIFSPERFLADNGRTLCPLIIAWPLAWLISFRSRSVRWWAIWAVAFTLYWFVSSQQLRFWVPVLPLAGIALYESIQWIMEKCHNRSIYNSAVWLLLVLVAVAYGASALTAEIRSRGGVPVGPAAREEYLTHRIGGYKAVRYVNENSDENMAVYVFGPTWLNYYLKPQVIDASGLLQMSLRPTFSWPADILWLRRMEQENVAWILINSDSIPGNRSGPNSKPVTPYWPGYSLVFTDSQVLVFRRHGLASN